MSVRDDRSEVVFLHHLQADPYDPDAVVLCCQLLPSAVDSWDPFPRGLSRILSLIIEEDVGDAN